MRIVKIECEEAAAYYDIEVPGAENYWADGVWHHNSGKTSGAAMDAIDHCTAFAGAKVLCVRKTQVSNSDTSVASFRKAYAKLGYKVGEDEDTSLFRLWDGGLTARVPSQAAIQQYNAFMAEKKRTRQQIVTWMHNEGDRLCSYIEFRGLKDEQKSEGQLRGYECSMFIMVEADLMDERDVDLAVGCLRWEDAFGNAITDYSIILDTNPPSPDHWIAELEKKHANNKRYRFWHIPTRENIQNLPEGYVENLEEQYQDKPAHYRRYVLGEYADLFEGKPVYHAYKPDKHAFDDIPWPKGAYLVVGWDFGSTHAVTFSAYFKLDVEVKGKQVPVEYWWDLYEFYDEQSDVERQCRAVQEILEIQFPFINDREICSGVMHYCFDEQTEVLTDRGWIPIAKWSGERVATLGETGKVEYQTPTHFHQPNFDGRMFKYENGRVDFCVTPGHKFPARDHSNQVVIEDFPSEIRIPVSSTGIQGGSHDPKFAAFLGWWIADGSLNEKNNVIQFAFKKQRKIDAVKRVLSEMGQPFAEYANRSNGATVISFSNALLRQRLYPQWKPKVLPEEFRTWDVETLRALLDAMMAGDGHWDAPNQGQFNTTSLHLAGQFQELLLLVGLSGNLKKIYDVNDPIKGRFPNAQNCYRVNVTDRKFITVRRDNLIRTEYAGKVYCLSVPNRTLYVRRNGCVIWSGNCDPAGANKTDKGSSIEVLNANGFYPQWQTRVRSLHTTIAIGNRLMEIKDPQSRYIYRIDKKGAPRLHKGLMGMYRYPYRGEPGYSSGEPVKGPRAGGADHMCFAAGTMVRTATGERPIESIRVGDLVWTRGGLCPVVACGLSQSSAIVKKYTFSNGREIVATLEHPVITRHGKIAIDSMRYSCISGRLWPKSKLVNTAAWFIAATLRANAAVTAFISNITQPTCIMSFGKSIMEPFRTAWLFITSTPIPVTMPSETWSALLRRFTCAIDTKIRGTHEEWLWQEKPQRLGTLRRKDYDGIERMDEKFSLPECPEFADVNIAGPNLNQQDCGHYSVLTPAKRDGGTRVASTILTWLVLIAARFVGRINIKSNDGASVAHSSSEMRTDVYALSVEEHHEFYANGILVSNCDAWRYSLINCLQLAKRMMDESQRNITGPIRKRVRSLNRKKSF